MRALPLLPLLTALLLGQAPLRIQSVDRRGLPPYDEGSPRLYRLDGGENRGLRAGDRLRVRRPGEGTLAHLRVVEVKAEWSLAALDQILADYPLKGDLVVREDLPPLPTLPVLGPAPTLGTPEAAVGSSMEAPPREGLLWFLPGTRDLSPAGEGKLAAWVEAWGREGHWAVLLPEEDALREARFESIREALARLGVHEAANQTASRKAEGPNQPAWIQHRD